MVDRAYRLFIACLNRASSPVQVNLGHGLPRLWPRHAATIVAQYVCVVGRPPPCRAFDSESQQRLLWLCRSKTKGFHNVDRRCFICGFCRLFSFTSASICCRWRWFQCMRSRETFDSKHPDDLMLVEYITDTVHDAFSL